MGDDDTAELVAFLVGLGIGVALAVAAFVVGVYAGWAL